MIFNPSNCSLKIQKTIRTPTPRVGIHLGVWVNFLTLSCTPRSVNVIPDPHLSMPFPWSWQYILDLIFLFFIFYMALTSLLKHQYCGDFYLSWFSFLSHLQKFNDVDWVDMPTCNLVETMHNIWLQQLGKHGTCLFIATSDDYVWAFK
jgi:hypothetical protein